MSKKSIYKKLMIESTFAQPPREATDVIANNVDAYDFFTSKSVFKTEVDEVSFTGMKFSSPEAKIQVDKDITVMSNYLGKASQQVIKTMMDGVKGGKYDAMDLARGIQTGPTKRTHYGEDEFIQQLWTKVRDGFRRYSKRSRLR
mgnify:FL=1|jgi:hypothetical protein|tara:strand:- start:1589 stop:2020 length:432 start_codon:yes stop_codon:yes gene_type:complete